MSKKPDSGWGLTQRTWLYRQRRTEAPIDLQLHVGVIIEDLGVDSVADPRGMTSREGEGQGRQFQPSYDIICRWRESGAKGCSDRTG